VECTHPLLFLKKTVPKEAREVGEILSQFGLEEYMVRVRTTAPGPDLAGIAQEWSNVSGRYESMLLDYQNSSSCSEE